MYAGVPMIRPSSVSARPRRRCNVAHQAEVEQLRQVVLTAVARHDDVAWLQVAVYQADLCASCSALQSCRSNAIARPQVSGP